MSYSGGIIGSSVDMPEIHFVYLSNCRSTVISCPVVVDAARVDDMACLLVDGAAGTAMSVVLECAPRAAAPLH